MRRYPTIKVAFQYFTYIVDDKGELQKVSRKDGQKYIVSPYSFCWVQDNYYILVSDGLYKRTDKLELAK